MVPPETKERLITTIGALNPDTQFLQGLGGIAPLLAAQADEFFQGPVPGVEYEASPRSVRITLDRSQRVRVDALWAEVVGTEPVARSLIVHDGELEAGAHRIDVPDDVPRDGSYVTVRAGRRATALRIGGTPAQVQRLLAAGPLPPPEPVTTRHPWTLPPLRNAG